MVTMVNTWLQKTKWLPFVVFVCVSRGNIIERQFGNDTFKYESIFAYTITFHYST